MTLILIDIAELDAGEAAKVEFPSANNLTKFFVSVTPDSGFWSGATYKFTFLIPDHYVSITNLIQFE
jgi:ubiquitin-conjugating enzyme E2 M